MTFVNKSEILELLSEFKIKKLVEKEEDSETVSGNPHHWHIFEFIAVTK